MIAASAIIDAAARHFAVPRAALVGRSPRGRSVSVILARRAAMFLADRHSGQGVEALAAFFEVTNGTVYNGIRAVETDLARQRAPYLEPLEASARSIDEATKRQAGMPIAEAGTVAHRVIVGGETPDADEVAALALAVLRSTPARDNPVFTQLIVAAVKFTGAKAHSSPEFLALQVAAQAAMRVLDTEGLAQ